jgi:hypothetical protein
MLDLRTTYNLTKFYVTIPYVEGHWEIMATDRVNAILRLRSTSWTESEWDSCSICKESRPVEIIGRERWLKEHCHEKVGDDMYVEKPCQPIPEQELILNCAPNVDCNKHSDIDPQGACIVGQEKNRAQDVCCPAYLEVNDCSWYHGTNPREVSKP